MICHQNSSRISEGKTADGSGILQDIQSKMQLASPVPFRLQRNQESGRKEKKIRQFDIFGICKGLQELLTLQI